LDEIGDLPIDIQGKLLRFLQERTFERVGGRQTLKASVRVVCATHRDLERAVEEGRFREDLYYRVRVVEIDLPPLRARGADEIEALALHFADMYSKRYGRPQPRFEPSALESMRAHRWPGNVRELEHWIESAIVLAPDGKVSGAHFPARRDVAPTSFVSEPAPAVGDGVVLPLGLSLEDVSRRYIEATVDACGGNKAEAARRLQIGRNTVLRSLKP
jgi:Nif-specific regulatory protein